MKFIKVLKANKDWEVLRRHHDTEDGEEYYYIEGPDGIYQDEDGNTYKFDTKEDALEELDYLKAEHKFDKKSADKKIKADVNEDLKDEAREYIDKAEKSLYDAMDALKQVIRVFNKLNIHSLDITPYMINYLDNMIDGENASIEDLKMRLQGDEEQL